MGDALATDCRVEAYVRLIRAAEAMQLHVNKGLAMVGLTASQFSTLRVLRLQGPLAQRDIAKYLLKSGGNVTMVVDNLEREGLVARVRDTEDRRIVFVKLTPSGEAIFDRVYPGHLDRIRGAVGELSSAQCEALIAILDRVGQGAEADDCARELAARSSGLHTA